MNCPSCSSPLEPNARFCGVCGYRLQARPAGRPQTPASGVKQGPAVPRAQVVAGGNAGSRPVAKPRPIAAKRSMDDIYLNQVLNNRFKIESKIGEGGFGAVYRGVQLATGRKVALKLLHPEMTKDENLVARFRQEGMVLCNLRDAHTITTYDFDQTPDGTLYIAMELLEGKSLHQIFHEQAPLEWKRVFKILTEMCSSLAEAHAQGIIHRDLKPENVYLENRPGNPEFVKILDFGIAKVMRGDSIDPHTPQLTATGQTLGTLEYMSPEQLMGKQLDGRSDVYALGVVAYEMITGRLPFPDAKGPAGLITAQLKQTPQPPSAVAPNAGLPPDADALILRALEKDKNNRFPDVTAMAAALQALLDHVRDTPVPRAYGRSVQSGGLAPVTDDLDLAETRRGELPLVPRPPMPLPSPQAAAHAPLAGAPAFHTPYPKPQAELAIDRVGPVAYPPPHAPHLPLVGPGSGPMAPPPVVVAPAVRSSRMWIWWLVALLALGAVAGVALALVA